MAVHDWLIVGAGFSGAVLAERIASQLGQRVLLVDRRSHIAGNAYDRADANGVLVQLYGPHLFHTSDDRVWSYLSRFAQWTPYEHHVRAWIDGKLVPVPFNFNTLDQLFPAEAAASLQRSLLGEYGPNARVPILKLRQSANQDVVRLADYIYKNLFEAYTLKQWGCAPEELGPAVTGRVPIVLSRDDRYFPDKHQAMPSDGFTAMFARMLDHPLIEVRLGTDYRAVMAEGKHKRMVYTGAIDSFFGRKHGPLPYRSLRFDFFRDAAEQLQPVATVNYPNSEAYTRITEFKHLYPARPTTGTTLVKEYPLPHVPGQNEAYYPIPKQENQRLFEKYAAEAHALGDAVLFVGRLADYKYYNMDQAVARALMLFDKKIAR